MIKSLVIADDITGALDTAVQYTQGGVSALVVTTDDPENTDFEIDGIDVLVVNIESRHLPPERAKQLVYDVVKNAIQSGIYYFYKKTDSALRGNIGAELEGLLTASEGNCLTFVPAFPENRRATRDGIHYVDGIELEKTVFAEDPYSPVKYSKVSDIIQSQSDIETEVIHKENYVKVKEPTEKKIIRIVDAETRDDIRQISRFLRDTENLKCLAGCAGFAESLPELLGLRTDVKKLEHFADSVLVVSGSVNRITMNQIADAEALGYNVYVLTEQQKFDGRYIGTEAFREFCADIANKVNSKEKVLITTARDDQDLNNIQKPERHIVSRNIGSLTAEIVSKCDLSDLVVFGGDTLHGILKELECTGVMPITSIAPGVVAAKPYPEGKIRTLISKSGGLGNEDVLAVIDEFLFGR